MSNSDSREDRKLITKRIELSNSQTKELEHQLAAARRNMAIEEVAELREAIRDEYQRIKKELDETRKQLSEIQPKNSESSALSPEEEDNAAIDLINKIRIVSEDVQARAAMPSLFDQLGLRIGLQFVEAIKHKKRRIRRLEGGIIAFGDTLRPGDITPKHSGDGSDSTSGCGNCDPQQTTMKNREKVETASTRPFWVRRGC